MFLKYLCFSFVLLHLAHPHLQINLHQTDWLGEDDSLQHHCLQVPAHTLRESDPRQIISYCLTESLSRFPIKENNRDHRLTFEQLAKENITNQQLYLWSAPIDLIEHYQFYLSKSPKSSFVTKVFYNCTLPFFGPQCQYLLHDHQSSLEEIVHDYYRYNIYEPTLLTCYMHLECNRGPSPSCLDWTEICDGKVDCLDGGYDEEHCWRLELHEGEHPHSNRECISQTFFRDDSNTRNCIDTIQTDDVISSEEDPLVVEPTFKHEDVSCAKRNDMTNNMDVLTSSCSRYRQELLLAAMFSIKPNAITDECWTALKSFIALPIDNYLIHALLCGSTGCREIINETCPDIIYIPARPVLLGHIYVVYDKNSLIHQEGALRHQPTYFCYNEQLLYIPDGRGKRRLPNNDTCHVFAVWGDSSGSTDFTWLEHNIVHLYRWLRKNAIPIDPDSDLLDKSLMYKCMNWPKYISKSRLFDGVVDCPHIDDEDLWNKTCSQEHNMNYFKCATSDQCLPMYLVHDGFCNCQGEGKYVCDDEHPRSDLAYSLTTISFQTICDGHEQLSFEALSDQNETDETNCEHWPRTHVYNRCDGFWHQLDGSDEVNCDPAPLLNCSNNEHICVSAANNQLMCLPMARANDGILDCLGAADEPTFCRDHLYKHYPMTFYCYQGDYSPCNEARVICDDSEICLNDEDERACGDGDVSGISPGEGICTKNYESDGSDAAKILCRRFWYIFPKLREHFALDQWSNLIKRHQKPEMNLPPQPAKQRIQSYHQRCHRGLDLQVWLDKTNNLTRDVCLCPPSYYGDTCQYQNQRVSLTLQFNLTSDLVQTPFTIVVSLIDESDERIVHSAEQFTYLSLKHCRKKFDLYLLYSTRAKDQTRDYFIQVDVYERMTLDYRVSLIKSLNFSFLPVHRLALQLEIPPAVDHCSNAQCVNGRCRRYFHDRNNRIFCQCKEGWSGRFCSLPFISTCSPQSLSLGKLANNRSLCICPVNQIGPRCFIDDTTCEHITCSNRGQCVSIDPYQTSQKRFHCICQQGFTGDQCQINRTKLIVTFDRNITLPSAIFIHFIEVKLDAPPVRTTTLKTTPFGQQSMAVYWSLPFHLVFVQLFNRTYYLTHVQTIYRQSLVIESALNSSHRCLPIDEVFNRTIANSSPLRRIKYYHLPCQTHASQLKCFYDEVHLCLCQQIDRQHVANCLNFDHNMTLYCSGQSGCENGGQCFQEQTSCPRVSVCRCPPCYYGARCQLSTSGFTLSLDAILGYHIRPNLGIARQPSAVLISLILALIITLLGFVNGLFSFITFQRRTTSESGCGLYLFTSSVVTLSTMIVFLGKFLILLLSHMGSISNRSFVEVQCHSMDFLLRCSLTLDQWLTASVAIERALILIKGVHFNIRKSKSTAKRAIGALILMAVLSNIHDPIYRSLLEENGDDDEQKKRLWCIVRYPPTMRTINLIVNILHFILPFVINCIAALVIIFMSTRQQAAIKKKKKTHREIFSEQLRQHRSLLIGPCVLIVLAIPRLIISFTSSCMQSASDSWIFLLGYFISLVPTSLTFVLFVLPSTTYKQAFRKAINRYRNLIGRAS